jgi:hypothetical protein
MGSRPHIAPIGAHAGGPAARGSVSLVIADALAVFEPNHVLVAAAQSTRTGRSEGW